MNGRMVKLLAGYSEATGRTRDDVKDWWKSLVEEDKDRARRNITSVVTRFKEEKKKKQRGGDSK